MNRASIASIAFIALAGCVPQGGTDTDPGSPPELADRYEVTSRWDLSSMLEDEVVGEAAAAVAVDLTVRALGVPSFLEDEATDAVDALIGDRIAAEVAALAASSQDLAALRDDLADALVESEWLLDGSDDRERLLAVTVETGGAAYTLALTGLDPVAEVSAPLAIAGSGTARTVEPHELALAAGELIRPAARAAVGAALATFDCAAIAEAVVGEDGELTVRVGGYRYTVRAADVEAVCLEQVDDLGARVLGYLAFEIGIELGGDIALEDVDGDGVADRLRDGEVYSGLLLGLPLPFAVSLDGRR